MGAKPWHIAYLDIIEYFIDADNSVKTVLLNIKYIKGFYIGENLAYNFIKLTKDYQFKDKLRYFILNNIENIDTIVKYLLISIYF